MNAREHESGTIAEVIVSAWRDADYRARLLADPAEVLTSAGLTLPVGCRVTVLEDTSSVAHLAVPRVAELAAGAKEPFLAALASLLPLRAGQHLCLYQDTEDERFLVLPLPPEDLGSLSDDDLGAVTGGTGGNGGNGGDIYTLGGAGGNGGNGGAGGILL